MTRADSGGGGPSSLYRGGGGASLQDASRNAMKLSREMPAASILAAASGQLRGLLDADLGYLGRPLGVHGCCSL